MWRASFALIEKINYEFYIFADYKYEYDVIHLNTANESNFPIKNFKFFLQE